MAHPAKKTSEDSGGHKWDGPLPKGWTDESREKFWNTLTGRSPKHKVTACIKKMTGTSISNPGAFCASLADRIIPGWRTEVAKERKAKRKKAALIELNKVAASLGQPLRTRRDYGENVDTEKDKPHSKLPGVDSLPMEEDHRIASQWITREEMIRLCPSCAVRMKKAGVTRVHVSVMHRMLKQR